MQNFIQAGDAGLTVAAPYDVLSGDIVVVGSLVGIAATDALTGADVEIVCEGVFDLPKDTTVAMSVGDRVFFNLANKWVDKTATAQQAVGVVVKAALAADTTTWIDVDPSTPVGT